MTRRSRPPQSERDSLGDADRRALLDRLAAERRRLDELVRSNADLTVAELRARMVALGVRVP